MKYIITILVGFCLGYIKSIIDDENHVSEQVKHRENIIKKLLDIIEGLEKKNKNE